MTLPLSASEGINSLPDYPTMFARITKENVNNKSQGGCATPLTRRNYPSALFILRFQDLPRKDAGLRER